jgi:hypothetical protein
MVILSFTRKLTKLAFYSSAALSSDPLRPPDLQEKSELGLSGSAYIGYEDFPALLSAVRTTHWPVVVRNKQCQMPMVGDDYHGPTCTGTLIAATSQDNCHMPTVVGGEDYSGPICTPPSGNQTTIILDLKMLRPTSSPEAGMASVNAATR